MWKSYSVIALVAFLVGLGLSNLLPMDGTGASQEKQPLYWVAPMDANYRRDGPGKSPMGMDLVPVYEEDDAQEQAPGTVNISSQVENQLGVKTAKVTEQALTKQVEVAGFLQYDDTTVQHYHSRVSGWVEKLYVFSVGDTVKRGQKLYDLYSPDLVYAQEEFVAAIKTGNQNLLQSSHLKLTALGVSDLQIKQLQQTQKVKQRLTFYAQQTGFVSDLNVREGMYIQPQIEVMATADLAKIWVMAEVFESQSNWLQAAQPVIMTVDALPGKEWQGKVDYIFPNVNVSNRAVQVRVVFDNPQHILKPNMFARLNISAKPQEPALVVPNDAVIYTGNQARVVLSLGNGAYRSVNVLTGLQAQGMTQILSGLENDQEVVTSAQFLIDSESNIAAEMTRMDSPSEESLDRVWVYGRVVEKEGNQLKLSHEPVEKWQWPAMTMWLDAQEGLDIKALKAGDEIGFCLDEFPNKQYLITHIEVQQAKQPEHAEMNHDGMNHD